MNTGIKIFHWLSDFRQSHFLLEEIYIYNVYWTYSEKKYKVQRFLIIRGDVIQAYLGYNIVPIKKNLCTLLH
jgi:hypothetical protein